LKVFRRSFGVRALSVGCALLFGALWIYHLGAGGALLSPGGLVPGLLLLLSAGASVLNLGDRYILDDDGIRYLNPLLSRLGLRVERRVSWREVVSVRAHRGISHGLRENRSGALFLDLSSGRRFVIDSVERFEEVSRLITEHAGRGAGNPSPEAPERRDPPAGPDPVP
jgi:hypothetical protein